MATGAQHQPVTIERIERALVLTGYISQSLIARNSGAAGPLFSLSFFAIPIWHLEAMA